jgi:hypothetical protein
MSNENAASTKEASAGKRERSPSFPYISLEKAVDRLLPLYTVAKRHDALIADAAKAWDYAAKSSTTLQTVAALLAYGLIEDSGSGDTRKIKVSDLGYKILIDQRPGAKEEALRQAALTPKLIAEYAQTWKNDRPGDNICLSELQMERNFTPDSAKNFLKVFDETFKFALDATNDNPSEKKDDKNQGESGKEIDLAIGDYIQWESNGVLKLEKPMPIRAFQEHEGVQWVFVKGSETGIPMSEVQVINKAHATPKLHFAPPVMPEDEVPLKSSVKEICQLDEGEAILILPKELSEASFEDLDFWFKGIIRKSARRAGVDLAKRDGNKN